MLPLLEEPFQIGYRNPMSFKTLPQGVVARILDTEEDYVSSAGDQKRDQAAGTPCPQCGGALQATLLPNYIFAEHDPLPRFMSKCVDCGYTFNPDNGMVIETGNPAQVEEELPTVEPRRD